jgi:hypothetical protein
MIFVLTGRLLSIEITIEYSKKNISFDTALQNDFTSIRSNVSSIIKHFARPSHKSGYVSRAVTGIQRAIMKSTLMKRLLFIYTVRVHQKIPIELCLR